MSKINVKNGVRKAVKYTWPLAAGYMIARGAGDIGSDVMHYLGSHAVYIADEFGRCGMDIADKIPKAVEYGIDALVGIPAMFKLYKSRKPELLKGKPSTPAINPHK